MKKDIPNDKLLSQVADYWNVRSCDTEHAQSAKFSLEYFEEIERFRYWDQDFIHAFAQFTRYHNKKVLEVGFGAGTDFIQWLRAGAMAHGVDLTGEALANLTHRIKIYQLPPPASVQVLNAEKLPFESNYFDLGYSFGVLHHSPDTDKAIHELVRVIRPGGELKIMLYNRYSIWAFNQWVRHALFKGRPWKSLGWVLWHYMESTGTKAYTRGELRRIFSAMPLANVQIKTYHTKSDPIIATAPFNLLNPLFRLVAAITAGHLGFFHCIHAVKTRG